MIEVYRNTSEKLILKLYLGSERVNSSSPVTVTLRDWDTDEYVVQEALATVETDDDDLESYYYYVPLEATEIDRRFELTWDYEIEDEAGQMRDAVEVVTPYALPDEVRDKFPELADKTFDEIKQMERAVRKIIDEFCHQTFTYYGEKTLVLRGNNLSRLWLPYRLISLTTFEDEDGDYSERIFDAREGDWTIEHEDVEWSDIKRDIWPGPATFRRSSEYTIVGDFGWLYPPNEVNLAALHLIDMMFCNQHTWLDQGIKIVRTGDKSFEFANAGKEGTTGSSLVDSLLMPFRVTRTWVL